MDVSIQKGKKPASRSFQVPPAWSNSVGCKKLAMPKSWCFWTYRLHSSFTYHRWGAVCWLGMDGQALTGSIAINYDIFFFSHALWKANVNNDGMHSISGCQASRFASKFFHMSTESQWGVYFWIKDVFRNAIYWRRLASRYVHHSHLIKTRVKNTESDP
jgi:hypothetical protein